MKLSARALRQLKGVTPIPMLTAYTTPVARSLEKAGVPVLLVGDTVGMVEMGFDSTRHTTVEHMEYHVGAVRRGAPNTHIIADLPFNSYTEPSVALKNARRLLDAGADSVKLEGPQVDVIGHLVASGIDVVGHAGLTPQTSKNFKQVGGTSAGADRVFDDAVAIAGAGVFMLVLEHIPAALGERVTQAVAVPTIGIGAGAACDGQVLVINDVLGLGERWPVFSKQYAYVGRTLVDAAQSFVAEVRDGTFADNVFRLNASGKE